MRKVLLGFLFGLQLAAMADENREPQNQPDKMVKETSQKPEQKDARDWRSEQRRDFFNGPMGTNRY